MANTRKQREIGRDGVEAFLVQRVRLLGGHSIKLAPMEAGIPDRLVLLPGGRMFLVEVKAEGEKPSAIQKHWHSKLLEGQQITVHVVTGVDGVLNWLRWTFANGAIPPRSKRPRAVKSA